MEPHETDAPRREEESRWVTDITVPACSPWSGRVPRGGHIRITDIEGPQAVDTLFYATDELGERYCAQATLRAQRNIYIRKGTVLMSNEDRRMLTVVADTLNEHDTVAGCCSKESNTVRYGEDVRHQHACRENFIAEMSRHGMSKRDIVSNINFFMRAPVTGDGSFAIVDGVSTPGTYVELRAEMDVLCVISNCPQINNPCNGYHPTAINVKISESPHTQ